MEKYLINGKVFEPKDAILLFSDGRFSNDQDAFYLTKGGRFIRESTSNWQGHHNRAWEISQDEFIACMLGEENHPQRAIEALEKAGLKWAIKGYDDPADICKQERRRLEDRLRKILKEITPEKGIELIKRLNLVI